MSKPSSHADHFLPTWLIGLGSAIIAGHLLAISASVLAVRSGPWPTFFGDSVDEPPQFATSIDSVMRPGYLESLRLAYHYDPPSNRPEQPGVAFEARLKNASGETVTTLKIPDSSANPWVQHRQRLLAQALAPDLRVEPPRGEVIAAPGRQVPTVEIWRPDPTATLQMRSVSQNDQVLREPDVWQPTELSKLLVRSYARYLCRKYGAASAEIVRRTRPWIPPVVVFENEAPPEPTDLVAVYGEFRQ
jgi:hypothetical protein